jgi:HEAT repeat protein
MLLMVWVLHLAAYEIKLFPASEVYDPDTEILHERLGVRGQALKAEDFEDQVMESWLHTNLKGGGGEGTDRTAWAGNMASAHVDSAQLDIDLPNVRLLEIGLADNDGGTERVSVNGNPAVQLKSLPGHVVNGRTRAYYLIIEAEPGDPSITSVEFDQCFTVHFDHLIVLQEKALGKKERLLPRLVLDLVDGTRLVGYYSDNSILASVRGEKLDLPLDRILSMQFQKGTDAATILLKNGEKVSGQVQFSALKVATILGDLSVPREKIRQLKVSFRGEYRTGQDAGREQLQRREMKFHADEPSFDGKSLRWWLQQCVPRPGAGKAYDLLAPDADAKSAERQAAERAIRQLGPEAISFLIEMLSRGDQEARRAVHGFEALGDRAKKALPDLMLLLDEPDEMIHSCTIWAIGHVGPAARSAVPVLLEELRAGSLPAAVALGNIGPASVEAVPIMIPKLNSGDQGYDIPFIIALGKIGSKDAVPILAEIAQGNDSRKNPEERGVVAELREHRAVEALGNIGPGAKSAVPVFVQLLRQQGFGNVTGLYFTERIVRALGLIGPDAREAAPLLREIAARQALQVAVRESAASALAKIQPETLE